MRRKKVIAAVVIGLAVMLAVGLRTANRADAAGGDCFSDSAGPSTPTICK